MKRMLYSAVAIVLLFVLSLSNKKYDKVLYNKLNIGYETIKSLGVKEDVEIYCEDFLKNYKIVDDELVYEDLSTDDSYLSDVENLIPEVSVEVLDVNSNQSDNSDVYDLVENDEYVEEVKTEDTFEDEVENVVEEECKYEEPIYCKNFYYIPDIPLSEDLQRFTYEMCEEFEIDYSLVLAIMYHESKFDPYAISYCSNGTYDSGIMQINSCNLEQLEDQFGITDLQNPYENIKAGVSIISGHVKRFGENDGLMAYNMGIGGYKNAVNSGIYSTSYSREILQKKMEYEELVCF